MNKKKRSFKEYLNSTGMDGIKKIALEYATENHSVTLNSLSEKYNLSNSAVKKVLEYAIVNCIVSYKIATFIKRKAHRNQIRHYKKDAIETSSDIYYNKIFEKRFNFVKSLDDDKVLEVVNLYISSPHLSGSAIADSCGFSMKEMNILLKKSIIFCIASDETVSLLKKVSRSKVKHESVLLFDDIFKHYTEQRIMYKLLNSKIAQLLFQLETYDSYAILDDESLISKDNIESQLEKAKTSLKNFKCSF